MTAGFGAVLQAEIGKLKGSLAALMILLGPLAVVVFAHLMLIARGGAAIEKAGWGVFIQGGIALWAYLVFPLLVALQAAAINNIEHAVDGWKRVFALPVQAPKVFLAKFLILLCLMLASSLILAAGLAGSAWVAARLFTDLPAFDPELASFAFLRVMACVAGGGLMIALHFTLSWVMDSFVFPIAVGVIATMAVMQVASSKYWIWHPWTWSLTAAAASDRSHAELGMLMGTGLGLLAVLLAAVFARRLRGVNLAGSKSTG